MQSIKQLADQLIPAPENAEALYKADGITKDIASEVLTTFRESNEQMARLAPYLKAGNIKETCQVIWQLVKFNIAYKVDPPGVQWIRTPSRLWADRVGDCKSYSVFIASCCYQLGIKCCFRFVSFNDKLRPTHVYVVVKSRGQEIILDAVMPAFNQQKPYTQKWDYNMTRISRLSGIPGNQQHISGGLSTALNQTGRRTVLDQAFPGLALLGLYIFIPGYGNTMPSYTHNSVGTPDDLWARIPQVVKDKTRKASDSFWDFGDWANIKVENDVFPKLKTLLTAQLGMDPAQWWRIQLKPAGIGNLTNIFNTAVDTAASSIPGGEMAKNILQNIKGVVGKLFGGTDIKWKRGDPGTWGPDPSDWASLGINPLAAIPFGGQTQTGQPLPVTYIPPQQPVQQPVQQPQQPVNTPALPANNTPPPPDDQKDNTMLYVGIAAVAAFVLLKK
jgi:hypothetical protein